MSRYLAFFKPFEVLTQFTGPAGRSTLADYIDLPGVYAAGRLDYRSEGLLILTDDGPLIQRLTDPRYEHPKTYYAEVEGIATESAVRRLESEIVVPGVQTRLAQALVVPDPGLPPRPVPVRNYHPTTWLRITLHEGKKHQVRRMTAAIGYPTLRLVRVSIGPVELGSLQPGEWRFLTPNELHVLRDQSSFKPGQKKR